MDALYEVLKARLSNDPARLIQRMVLRMESDEFEEGLKGLSNWDTRKSIEMRQENGQPVATPSVLVEPDPAIAKCEDCRSEFAQSTLQNGRCKPCLRTFKRNNYNPWNPREEYYSIGSGPDIRQWRRALSRLN